jgi:predicted N-formylglutamate amidohydrolase
MDAPRLVLTCEHGGNTVPHFVADAFKSRRAQQALTTHRGRDIGALWLAKHLQRDFDVPLVHATVSRLVVDLNRTIGHPRHFSEFTRSLDVAQQERLLARYYMPYRRKVTAMLSALSEQGPVLHVSVHSFVAVLDGKQRNADIGLLYDPARSRESEICKAWQAALTKHGPTIRVRRNYPYRGSSDGFTSHLRSLFADALYAGIELEVNQAVLTKEAGRRAVHAAVRASLQEILTASP